MHVQLYITLHIYFFLSSTPQTLHIYVADATAMSCELHTPTFVQRSDAVAIVVAPQPELAVV